MTDPNLTHHAEQALLGALITRQRELDAQTVISAAGGLRPQDFTDPRHQAIYAAITGQGLTRRGGLARLGERLRDMLARLLGSQARELAAYTAGLPARCPDPAHLSSYAGMVAAASGQRAAQTPAGLGHLAARQDPRLESAAAWLEAAAPARSRRHHRPAATATAAARPHTPSSAATTPAAEEGPPAASARRLPAGTARLARLLRPGLHAPARQEDRQEGQPRPPARDSGEDLLPGARDRAPVPARDSLQEQVLAGLMHDPGLARQVTAWLPAAVFAPGVRRDLYGLICSRLVRGEPTDPLILAWEAAHPAGGGAGGGPDAPAHGELLPAAALRIGELRPDPETAAALGRALYATHLCEHVFGPGWEHTRGPAHLAAAITQPARSAGPAVRTATAGETVLPDSQVPAEPAVRPVPQPAPAAASAPAAGPESQPGGPARHPGPEPAAARTGAPRHPGPEPAAARTGAPRRPGRAPAGTTPARPVPSAPALPVQAAPPGQEPGAPVPAGPAQRM